MSVSTDAVKGETPEPVSAFSVYAERLRRKKKPKTNGPSGGVIKTKKNFKNKILKDEQMREIGMILQKLAENHASNKDVPELKDVNPSNNQIGDSDVMSKLAFFNIKSKSKDQALNGHTNKKSVSTSSLKKGYVNSEDKNPFATLPSTKSMHDTLAQPSCLILNGKTHPSTKRKKDENKKTTNKNSTMTQNSVKNVLTKTINMETNTEIVSFNSRHSDEGIYSLSNNQKEKDINKVALIPKLRHRKLRKLAALGKSQSGLPKRTLKKKQFYETSCKSPSMGLQTFEWVILPVAEQEFSLKFWERQPLLIQRKENQDFYSQLLSTPLIDDMLRENVVYFTKHLDVTSYSDGVRETHNLTGRANANVVWDFYSNGCSIRLLNPQAFFPPIHSLNATLQEYFGCFVGANVYLTPPNSQGFAPHYDDIEAFVLQVEGKKRWKLYAPRNDSEVLARFSSPNFSQDEIGQSCLDVVLEPGDMLYFPRGYVHQAFTVDNCHSLHITLSTYQKTAWVDLFEKALPLALESAVKSDVEFRRGLPRDYLNCQSYGGDAVQGFKNKAKHLFDRLAPHLMSTVNAAVDKMGAQFMHDALPPVLTPEEEETSVSKGGLRMVGGGVLENMVDFEPTTTVKLIRANVCRLVNEEGETRLYHCMDNSLEYHAEDPQFLVLPPGGAKVIRTLAYAYPSFIPISKLPHSDMDGLFTLISDLWDAGLLLAEGLNIIADDSS